VQFTNDPKLDLKRTFRKPYERRSGAASLLGLLRSDLQQFYGPESTVVGSVTAPLLAALGICAGLELLTKYWSGCPDVQARTVSDFLTTVARLSAADAEIILQFRNSLAHGYALGTRRRRDSRPFTYTLDTGGTSASPLISYLGADNYVINLWSLKRLFQIAIGECKRRIERDQQRLMEFQVCIRNLGEIGIAP
jgi:hypothetical protein